MDAKINKSILSSRLRQFRRAKGLTQAKLAEMIGVSTVNYAKYECGSRTPSLSKLVEISLALGKPIECFLLEERADTFLSDEQIEELRSLPSDKLVAILEVVQGLYHSQK